MRVHYPGGLVVQAAGRRRRIPVDEDEPPEWALYLDHRWRRQAVPWERRFVDWPDFRLPVDELDAFSAFTEAWERTRQGQLVQIACSGGIGRTGTALACLAVLAGIPPEEAIDWVRQHHHPRAVETRAQAKLVSRFAIWATERSTGIAKQNPLRGPGLSPVRRAADQHHVSGMPAEGPSMPAEGPPDQKS